MVRADLPWGAGPADLRTIVADRVRGVPQETGRVSFVSAFFRGSASGREAAAVYPWMGPASCPRNERIRHSGLWD